MRMFSRRNSAIAILLFCFALNLFSAELKLPFQIVESGVDYAHQSVTNIPWSIHIIRIDRHYHDLQLTTTLAKNKIFGLSSVVEQVGAFPANEGRVVTAINGDFFILAKKPYQGDPRGLQIINGELVSAPDSEVCFWLNDAKPKIGKVVSKFKVIWPDKTETRIGLNEERAGNRAALLTPSLGDSTRTTNGVELVLERDGEKWLPLKADENYFARVQKISGTNTPLDSNTMILWLGPKVVHPTLSPGMKLKISTDTTPNLNHVQIALGGGPTLVKNGKPLARSDEPASDHARKRNPRTAFGWNDAYFYFVVVDGRRQGISAGMTFAELADEMAALGCREAINLDGGGSSTLWANGKVLNQPSDNHDRGVANALICVRRKN